MKRMNKNYKSESIQIKSIPIKSVKSIQKKKTKRKTIRTYTNKENNVTEKIYTKQN